LEVFAMGHRVVYIDKFKGGLKTEKTYYFSTKSEALRHYNSLVDHYTSIGWREDYDFLQSYAAATGFFADAAIAFVSPDFEGHVVIAVDPS
jgi:hypothetical protein